MLIKGDWVSDPVVTVEFANLHFTALGEVGSPGTHSIDNDRITLLEAISMVGDLTIYGNRNITVIREEDGKRTKYLVDLKDDNLFNSPRLLHQTERRNIRRTQWRKGLARLLSTRIRSNQSAYVDVHRHFPDVRRTDYLQIKTHNPRPYTKQWKSYLTPLSRRQASALRPGHRNPTA